MIKQSRQPLLATIMIMVFLLHGHATAAESPSDSHLAAGRTAYQVGDYKTALKNWLAAEEKIRSAKNTSALSELLWLRAEAHRALGQHSDALLALTEALSLKDDKTTPPALQASMLSSYGDSLALNGNWKFARRALKRAVNLARKTNDDKLLAVTLNNFGNNLFKKGYYISAVDAYTECSDVADRSGNTLLFVQSTSNIAKTHLLQDNLVAAKRHITIAINKIGYLPDSHTRTSTLISLGVIALDIYKKEPELRNLQWLKHAHTLLSDADTLANRLGDIRSRSYATGYLSDAYASQNRYEEALLLTDKAIHFAQKSNAPDSEYLWHWRAAKLHKKLNNIDAAIAAYRLAVENIQLIRHELPTSTAFKNVLGPVFFELTDLLLQRPNELSDKNKIEDYLKEARQTMELLKAAELQDYFQDNCVTALQSRTEGLDNIQDRTAVLYPILLQDRMEILLSFGNSMDRAVVKVNADELRKTTTKFRLLLEDLRSHDYLKYSKQLYDLLIRPMQPILDANNIDTLVIVPDSVLRTIPMAALHDGKKFLISKYALAVTPGLTLTDPKPLARDKLEVLVGGLTEGVQGFSPLPSVAIEVDNIKNTYNSTVLMNKDYNVSDVEGELSRTHFNVVHIASHAQFSSKPEETFLLAHDDKFTMDRLESLMGQTKFRDDPVELIALSACQTAAGDERAALGLAGIAIKAGARSALATLWFINDKASSLLVSEFYKQLRNPSLSKAQALQQAQLKIMRDERYQHPLFWSPFLLIGNWL
ncbi:MAG: CHAT domain-containing protein [Granulosicoccaceae bacterium]